MKGCAPLCPSESSAQQPDSRVSSWTGESSSRGICLWPGAPSRKNVPPALVGGPTLLLAVSSALWSFALAGGQPSPKARPTRLLPVGRSSRVLRLLTLAGWPEPSSSSRGLLAPFGTNQVQRSTWRQGSTPTLVPPSGFGYPLGGFLPLDPSEPSM
jgi:hypothetical protein